MAELSENGEAVAAAAALRHGRPVVIPVGANQSPVELPKFHRFCGVTDRRTSSVSPAEGTHRIRVYTTPVRIR